MARVEQIAAGNLAAILQGTASGATAALRALILSNDLRTVGQFDPGNHAPNSGPTNNGQVTLTYTTFIPSATVTDPMGNTFSGDNRTFDQVGTSRTTDSVTINTQLQQVTGRTAAAGDSHLLDANGRIIATANAGTSGFSIASGPMRRDGGHVFVISGSSTNPLATIGGVNYAPSIDYRITVYSSRSGIVTIKVNHDGFPAHQLNVNGKTVYTFDPGRAGTTPMNLFPPLDQRTTITIPPGGP
jgi:hypothetical protein